MCTDPLPAHMVSFSVSTNHILTIIAPKHEITLWNELVTDLEKRTR
jgi:hypothetical protein